ncbi:hypothetical protein BV898_02113 [Hypsibius exemplaris]|uniref:Uncharacterized protein n=1 Tax=Hypsibius exemplaris TaxID=2072580 RepID=A0A1W0X9I8_HYPEX|nr:hypothetical protein BV898_02113 [Hypsibius exemplaris]
MDELISAVKTVLAPVVKAVVGRLAKTVGNTEKMKTTFNWTEEEIDAKVDKVLGDGFAQQLLDIKIYFDGALSGLEKKIHLEILDQAVLTEFRAVQQRIAETQLRYAQWLSDPLDRNAQDRFLRAYERNDPEGALHWLHTRLTTEDVGKKLIDDIVTKCRRDWKQFAVWEQHICILVFQACSADLAYLWINSKSPGQSQAVESEASLDVSFGLNQATSMKDAASLRSIA